MLLNILFSGEQGVIVIKVDAFSLGVSTGFGLSGKSWNESYHFPSLEINEMQNDP